MSKTAVKSSRPKNKIKRLPTIQLYTIEMIAGNPLECRQYKGPIEF